MKIDNKSSYFAMVFGKKTILVDRFSVKKEIKKIFFIFVTFSEKIGTKLMYKDKYGKK